MVKSYPSEIPLTNSEAIENLYPTCGYVSICRKRSDVCLKVKKYEECARWEGNLRDVSSTMVRGS